MTKQLSLAERRERLREALNIAQRQAEERLGFDWATVGSLMKELSHDIEALEQSESGRQDSTAHDKAEERLRKLLAELEASHDDGDPKT